MSYRRKRDDAQELRRYKAFCLNNSTLIDQVGLPSFVVEDYNAFMYVLMHGETWSDAPITFEVSALQGERRAAYLLLLEKYFEAGLQNPGLWLLEAERAALAQKYPEQLTSYCK
jgi:hypothetical protein